MRFLLLLSLLAFGCGSETHRVIYAPDVQTNPNSCGYIEKVKNDGFTKRAELWWCCKSICESIEYRYILKRPKRRHSSSSCLNSKSCRFLGKCGLVNNQCKPTSDEHCQQSKTCKLRGRCSVVNGECVKK